MKIVFDNTNKVVCAGKTIPDSHTGDEYTITTLPEGDSFDPNYSYSPVEGKAIKGDLIPIDTAEVARMEAEALSTQYQRDRENEYPSVGDQLDQLMKDMRDGTTTHKDACEAVKAKYPKPE
jgi:hypothetical protein